MKYGCNHCDYQATRQGHLTAHIQTKHDGVKYACNKCDQQFTQQVSLTIHIQSKSSQGGITSPPITYYSLHQDQ